ncbi:hypothetical protein HOG98_04975 [bacterium]|jgi:hypothetical protein|nr:hypothetical protein [bacterium]
MNNLFHLVDIPHSEHKNKTAPVKVLVPGWATDCRLFKPLQIEPPFIECTVNDPFVFSEELTSYLTDYLKTHPSATFSFFGFSMGALLISQLIKHLSSKKIQLELLNIIFCGMRYGYSSSEIDTLKAGLHLNTEKQLKQFYRSCFYSPQDYKLFFKDLGKSYLSSFEPTHLFSGLQFLEKYTFSDKNTLEKLISQISPNQINVHLFQGSFDLIAPLNELENNLFADAENETLTERFQLFKLSTGHIPFYNEASCNQLSKSFPDYSN